MSPDGKFIVTGSKDKTAKVWDSTTRVCGHFGGSYWGINSVAVSPDRKFIVTGSYDKTAKIWDSFTKECVGALKGHASAIFSVAVSPNGKFIVTGSYTTGQNIGQHYEMCGHFGGSYWFDRLSSGVS